MPKPKPTPLRCSFCHKSQDVVSKMVSAPSDYPEAHICDECVRVCNTILEDEGVLPPPVPRSPRPSHCLMCHPMAYSLLLVVEQWVMAESQGRDAAAKLAEVRDMARAMMGLGPA